MTEQKNPLNDGEGCWQFYRCYRCRELITDIQLKRALETNGQPCSCGCMKVIPTNVKPEEYAQANVVEMAIDLGFDADTLVADFLLETPQMEKELQTITAVEIRRLFGEVACT